LLNKRLAACVQIFPINSSYWWKNKIVHAKEWMCSTKARESAYQKIETVIKNIHPYAVPEIIAIPIVKGSKNYLKWLEEETS
jgi:periplasmic divalent cation tolerance protein